MDVPKRLIDALPGLLKEMTLPGPPHATTLKGDASNRSYFRITAGNRSFIAMLLAEKGPNSPAEEITKTARAITELPFIDVQKYLESRRVVVPSIYGYDAERGAVLLEDFGDLVLYDVLPKKTPTETRNLYEVALEQLERLAPIPDTIDTGKCIAFARSFDRDLYNWEFLHFVEYALDRRLKNPPAGEAREKILNALYALSGEYLGWGNVLCHRDYHSKNLMVIETKFAGPRLGVLDFQDALLAPLFYDLASLLRDSYVTLEPKMQNDLVEAYRLRMKERKYNETESRDAFRRAFDLMGLHRNLKAAGRFFYIDEVKKNPNYLQHIPRTLAYVKKTLEDYEELKALRVLMAPYFDELVATCPS
jgi:aminoglycoside/choline kinase family phosphotransferase